MSFPYRAAFALSLMLVGCASTPVTEPSVVIPAATPADQGSRPDASGSAAADAAPATPEGVAGPVESTRPAPAEPTAPEQEQRPENVPAVDRASAREALEKLDSGDILARGKASYYHLRFNGRRTASGQRYKDSALTAAHRTLPFGSQVRVTNTRNGRSVVVTVNDRGPFIKSRIIDLSGEAARKLGLMHHGLAEVVLSKP